MRHNVDVMHAENDVFDMLLGTLLDMNRKTRDISNARREFMRNKITEELHPIRTGTTCMLLHRTSSQRYRFIYVLKHINVPNNYASNLSRCILLRII